MRNLKIIIPAAGYGVRMGKVPAKELLPHPKTRRPFIVEAIEKHKCLGSPFHIISRNDKMELNHFLYQMQKERKDISIDVQLIDPSKEWPETILRSEPYWFDWNLLLLPDADYTPLITESVISDLLSVNEFEFHFQNQAYFFVFNTMTPSLWSLVDISPESFDIVEKPSKEKERVSAQAWGLILFHRKVGKKLFRALLESSMDHQWKFMDFRAQTISLNDFEDLTRGS